jgi:serine/threonine protein phosphatase PrpC
MAVFMGDITQKQIRFHEDRNRVLRALGSETARPEISPTVMLTGGEDVFLLCTDGFWEYVYEEEMEALLRKSQSPRQWLEDMEVVLKCRAPQGNDNFTATAVFF